MGLSVSASCVSVRGEVVSVVYIETVNSNSAAGKISRAMLLKYGEFERRKRALLIGCA